MEIIDYVRYLKAKTSVDDRTLNQNVLETFEGIVRAPKNKTTLRIVDIGAGIGAMLFRLLDRRHIFEGYLSVEYTIVDVKEEVLKCAHELLCERLLSVANATMAKSRSDMAPHCRTPALNPTHSVHHVGIDERNAKNELRIEDIDIQGSPTFSVRFRQADAQCFLLGNRGKFDVVLAAAFLDLFCLDVIIPIARESLDEASAIRAFYFPVTFDGTTVLPPLPDEVISHFHISMGTGFVGGQKVPRARSGSNLLPAITSAGGRVSAAGPSIWCVKKDPTSGAYTGDEAYFLECILRFIQSSLTEEFYTKVSRSKVTKMFEVAKEQLESLSLKYEAHNIDVCGVF